MRKMPCYLLRFFTFVLIVARTGNQIVGLEPRKRSISFLLLTSSPFRRCAHSPFRLVGSLALPSPCYLLIVG
jgi:hypothetical protein